MNFRGVFLLIFFIHSPAHPVLVCAEKLTNPDGKTCYIYSDAHEYPTSQDEEAQLKALTGFLENRETFFQSPLLDIFIEQPLSVATKYDPYQRVTSSLKTPYLQQQKLLTNRVIPSEIRCASLATLYMLDKIKNQQIPEKKLIFSLHDSKYSVEQLTFLNLDNEFQVNLKKLMPFLKLFYGNEHLDTELKYFDNTSRTNKSWLAKYYNEFKQEYKQANRQSPLLPYIEKCDSRKRSRLWTVTSQLFEHLFNLHLFKSLHRTLNNPLKKEAMLISGYLHALKVSQMLHCIGFETSKYYSTGYNPYGGIINPLPANQLDLLEKDSFQECIVL